jgi:hypothetical protein
VFNPILATGVVFSQVEGSEPRVTGSCAAYGSRNVFITASHCIPEGAKGAAVLLSGTRGACQIEEYERHDTSDLALLFAKPSEDAALSGMFFKPGPDELPALGTDFLAYGFPSIDEAPGGLPYPRMLKGHFQRYFGFKSPEGLEYFAGEMSIPAPPGLSGSPIMLAHAPQLLVGIVAANLDSYTTLSSFEQVDSAGTSYREVSKRIVSYGISAMFTKGKVQWAQEAITRLT